MASARAQLLVAVALILLEATHTANAYSCNQVSKAFGPCVPYAQGYVDDGPSIECCNGIKSFGCDQESTSAMRETCRCLSTLQLRHHYALGIPYSCGVVLPFPISVNADCSTVESTPCGIAVA